MSLGSLSPSVISSLVDLADFGNILMLVNEITLTLAFTWAPGDVGTLLSAIFIKMGQSPKYSSIYFSTRLEVMLLGSKLRKGLLSYAPEIPLKMLMSYRFPPTTGRFSLYSIPSRFIYNFWIPMIFIAIITGAWLIIWLVEFLLRSPQKGMTPHFICRKVRVAFQNFLVGLIYCNFGDIMMYVILEFQGTKYYTNNDWFSWILALLFLILIVVMLCRHVHVLINYQRLKKAEKTSPQAKKQLADYKYNREGLSLWFSSFKDTSFVNQAFLMFFMARVLLCYILFGAMTESPHAESILVFCITIIFIIFACIKRPFNSTIDFVQYILYEVVTLLLNISLLILATLDAKLDLSLSLRNTMSEIILSTPFIFGFLSPIFLITKLVLLVIKYYKAQPGAKVDPNTSAVNNSVSHEGLIGFDNSRGGDQIEKEMGRVRPRQRKADRLDETVHSIGEMHDNPSAATLHPPSSYNNYNNGNSYNNGNNGNGGYSGNGNGAVLKKKVFANNGGANYGTPYSQQQYQPQYNQQQQERNYQYDQRQEGNNQYNQRQQGNYQQNQRQERNYQYDQQQEGNYQYNQRQERNYQYNEQQEGDYQYNQRQERNYQYNENNGQRGQRNYGGNYERNNYRGRSHERANEYVRTGERRVISQTERGAKRQQVERMEEGPVRGGAYARSRVWHRKLNRDAYRGGQLPGRVQDDGQETNFRSQIESRNRYV